WSKAQSTRQPTDAGRVAERCDVESCTSAQFWRYCQRGSQLSLTEIRDDGPAEPPRHGAATPSPRRPPRQPQSALAAAVSGIESKQSRSASINEWTIVY